MPGASRVTVIALDAADPGLVRELAAAGEMPATAGLLEHGTQVETLAPPGVFVSANWPTIFTSRLPDRHGYLCWEEIPGGTYHHRLTDPTWVDGVPFWRTLSQAGRRVAVLDVPHTIVEPLDGVMLAEWGCHDRHLGTASHPPGLAAGLTARHGDHLGSRPVPAPGFDQFAPCDYTHRAGDHRTGEETVALFRAILDGLETKRRASLELLDRGGWDLFLDVLGESHCVGHQLWHLHDPTHPHHDPALVARLGGDPVREVYRRLDDVVGDHLARLGPEDTAYLLLAHGMTVHNDGTHLLDHVLQRLDWGLDHPEGLGAATRVAAAAARRIPKPVRPGALRRAAPLVRRAGGDGAVGELRPRGERRWFLTPNNTVVGGVRLNLAGREPYGRIHPEDRRAALRWLADRLAELVNLETGGRVVTRCELVDDVYRRRPGDALPDLFVEWERSAPIERVWSPAVGTVTVPYEHWRQGDHERGGLVVGRGPGLRPGRQRGVRPTVDLGATFAAALGVKLGDVDGQPIPALLPAGAARPRRRPRAPRLPTAARPPAWARRQDPALPRATAEIDARLRALADRAEAAARRAEEAERRLDGLDRRADIATMTAWLREAEAPDGPLVSVVTPTRDRAALLTRAVASVAAQTYPKWELVVVDDGSSDDTPELLARLEDPRIRVLRTEGIGACAARNRALDAADGELVAYLDDDNRFDPDWLKAVVHTFANRPERGVLYGARIVDDGGRLFDAASTARPFLHYAAWDPEAVREGNLADMGVIAHRRSDVRFDESLAFYGDWDLLLRLTRADPPVEVPAVAVYYRTDHDGRMSTALPPAEREREFRQVREKLAAAGTS